MADQYKLVLADDCEVDGIKKEFGDTVTVSALTRKKLFSAGKAVNASSPAAAEIMGRLKSLKSKQADTAASKKVEN